MKKIIILLLCLLTACSSKSKVTIDYGPSDIYRKEDMEAPVKMIQEKINSWEGIELHDIEYAGDKWITKENLKWMNDLQEDKKNKETFTQVIMFTTDFHTSKDIDGAWNQDFDYEDWQWWFARTDTGEWNLMTYGY